MNPLLLAPLLDVGKTLLDRFIPDPRLGRGAIRVLCLVQPFGPMMGKRRTQGVERGPIVGQAGYRPSNNAVVM